MPTTLAPIAEAEVEMYANRDISNDLIPMTWNSAAKVQRHASVITPIRLENRTELKHQRFVPLALLFPIALRY